MGTVILGIATGAVIGLVALGIVLVYKSSRVLNFAQAEFATAGAYLSWFLTTELGWSWPAAWAVAVAALTVVGVLFERLVLRPMGDASKVTLSVATIGLLFLLAAVEIKAWTTSPRLIRLPFSGGVAVFDFVLTGVHLLALATLVVLALGLGFLVSRTRLGLGLLAVAEDPATARLMGVPYERVAAATWGAAGALGALAGLLAAPLSGAIAPTGLTVDLFVPGLTAALLGGLTSLPGAFIGALLIGVLQAELKTHLGGIIGISSYGMLVVIMAVLLIRPRGLFGREA